MRKKWVLSSCLWAFVLFGHTPIMASSSVPWPNERKWEKIRENWRKWEKNERKMRENERKWEKNERKWVFSSCLWAFVLFGHTPIIASSSVPSKLPGPRPGNIIKNLKNFKIILLLKRERTDTGSLGHFSPLSPISSSVPGPILTKFYTRTPVGSESVFAQTEFENSDRLPWKSGDTQKDGHRH